MVRAIKISGYKQSAGRVRKIAADIGHPVRNAAIGPAMWSHGKRDSTKWVNKLLGR